MSTIANRSDEHIRMVLHPTDFTEASQLAFAHALRVAVTDHAGLSILHVNPGQEDTPWNQYPSVRSMLERWGILERGSPRSEVFDKLGIRVEKVEGHDKHIADAIVGYLQRRPFDMIVLATRGREGMPRWLKPSISEPVARRAHVMTLFVPQDCTGCVSPDDGTVTMDQVLIPVDHQPAPQPAIARAVQALELFGGEDSMLTLLHVGNEGNAPQVTLPSEGSWNCAQFTRPGDPVEVILKTAEEMTANLIIMVTEGRQGFLDALRGTTTEQVVRRAPCPVLAVPVGE